MLYIGICLVEIVMPVCISKSNGMYSFGKICKQLVVQFLNIRKRDVIIIILQVGRYVKSNRCS